MRKVEGKSYTEKEFEHELLWSSLGGTVSTAQGVHALLMKSAGDYYASGQDEVASAFRSFAKKYEETVVKPRSEELKKFINGAKK